MKINDQAVREDVDRNPPRLKARIYETPKVNCYLYTYSAYKHTRKQQKFLL